MKKKTKCYIYTRVSTAVQVKEQKSMGLSLRTLEIKSDVRRLFVYREFFTGIINMTDSCHVELDMIGMEYEKR